jgi:hypothetical protein
MRAARVLCADDEVSTSRGPGGNHAASLAATGTGGGVTSVPGTVGSRIQYDRGRSIAPPSRVGVGSGGTGEAQKEVVNTHDECVRHCRNCSCKGREHDQCDSSLACF